MNNQIISIAYSTFINKGAFALLLGSGISRQSGIPTGWEITLKLIEQIATLEKQRPLPTPEQWYTNYFKTDPDYSDILERLTNTPEERLNLLKPFIEPTTDELEKGLKTPTRAHREIARLVKLGYIRVIITTNFDRLLENALKEEGIEPTILSNPNHVENSIPLIHSKITIIKINGDYLDTKFLNIKSELEQYDPRLTNLLNFIFENFGLITCGWSAKWDIALVELLKSASKFRYSTYLTYLSRIESELRELKTFRQSQLVQIKSADSFFTEYVENIEALEQGNDHHPLSPQITLQRTKKYLAKEEHIIAFNDLLIELANDVIQRTSHVELLGVPNLTKIKTARDQYVQSLEVIMPTIVTASFWAKPYQHERLLAIIKLIASSNLKEYSYKDWSNITHFPSLLLRYGCGVAAVASRNFQFVQSLSSLLIKTSSRNLTPLNQLTNPFDVIEEHCLNEIEGKSWVLPMSEWVYAYLRPLFREIVPVDSDFAACFDYYEFIYALMLHRVSEDKFWYASGRFAHNRDKIAKDYLEKAEKEGDTFELIKAGLFDSLTTLKQEFAEFSEFFHDLRLR